MTPIEAYRKFADSVPNPQDYIALQSVGKLVRINGRETFRPVIDKDGDPVVIFLPKSGRKRKNEPYSLAIMSYLENGYKIINIPTEIKAPKEVVKTAVEDSAEEKSVTEEEPKRRRRKSAE